MPRKGRGLCLLFVHYKVRNLSPPAPTAMTSRPSAWSQANIDCEPETVSQDESLCILFLSRICLQRCKSYKVGVPWSPDGRCAEWSTMSSASEQQKLLVFLALTTVTAEVRTGHGGVAGSLWVF